MKQYFYSALTFILVGIMSCSNESVDKPIKAKIVIPTSLGYTYKEVEISSLTSIDPLEGTYVDIKGNAELDIAEDVDEIVKSSSPTDIYKTKGEKIKINYIVKDGVVVPKDFASLSALTIYHNYETVFKFWEDNFSLSLTDFGKLTIYNNPKLTFTSDDLTATVETKVNAAFLPGTRDFWFFKKSGIAKIPLKMNLGVLAHEFSHAIFDDRFAERSVANYETASEEADFILSGINEGIADYFAFMVTGRVTDFSLSIEQLAEEREMPVPWRLSTVIDAPCFDSFYCIGSIVASSLYEISNSLASKYDNSRVEVGKAIYAALGTEEVKTFWDQYKDSNLFLISHLLIEIKNQADPADLSVYCESFKKWFDTPDELEYLEANGCI